MLQRLLRFLWWSVAALVVTLAVTLSAARLLLPEMSEYRSQIESLAADYLHRQVRIGSLDAAWHGLSPVLRLKRVVVSGGDLPAQELLIDEVQVALDLVDTLWSRKWRTAGIRLIGLELAIDTDLVHRRGSLEWLASLGWLLHQRSISLEQLRLHWNDPGLFPSPVLLEEVSLQLLNEGARHQFLLNAPLASPLGESVRVSADFRGPGNDPARWRGKLYVKTVGLDLAAIGRAFPGLALRLGGRMDLELWAGVRKLAPIWGRGAVSVRQASFANRTADAQSYQASSIGSRFHWRHEQSGWRLELKQFSVRRQEREVWPVSDFRVRLATTPEVVVRGYASHMVIEEIDALLPLLPWVDADALAMVDRLQPRGMLNDVDFRFRPVEGGAPRFALRAALSGLGMEGGGGMPGVSGLSGRVEGNLQSGKLFLESQHGTLNLPKVFPQALAVDALHGVVRWQRYRDLFRIESHKLTLRSGPLGMEGRLRLDWRYDQPAPWADLQLALDDIGLAQVADYLPTRVMRPRAVAWLKRALVSGTASNGRFLLQGRLDQIPFDARQGRLEARFDFEDVVLAYHPDWGTLEELRGTALFDGRSMRITGTSGRIQDARVQRVVAVIDDLKNPLLNIKGTAEGTLDGMLAYVDRSPLGARFGALTRDIDPVGDASLLLDLDVPLRHGLGTLRVDGDVLFDDNDLMVKGRQVGLTDIRGTLHFSRRGLSARKIRAKLFGRPVQVSVYREGKAAAARTVVDVDGLLGYRDFNPAGDSLLAARVDGRARWHLLLRIAARPGNARLPVELVARSDLKGMTVRLPSPLGKSAGELRPLELRWNPAKEGSRPIRVRYGDDLRALLLMQRGRPGVRRADIRIGSGPLELPVNDAIRVRGRLPDLDLGEWLALFHRQGGAASALLPLAGDLEIGHFYFGRTEVDDIRIRSSADRPWYFTVSGKGAEGWLRWHFAAADRPASLQARFARLQVGLRDTGHGADASRPPAPSAVPQLDVQVEDLVWAGRELGQVTVKARHEGADLVFDTLAMSCKAVVLKGHGAWRDDDGRQSSGFEARIEGGELGELVKLFGEEGSIKGGKLQGSVRLDWPGSPADFSLGTVEGELSLKAKDGRLVKVSGGGAGRLLSLVNLDSLTRRLSLDFSDVFREGFSFDVMKGDFVIMDGDAFTNDFTIKGSSADIEMVGRTGLVAHDYDQLVTVTPQISSTLPIAGVIAGGPVVGAAAYLADKLVGKTLNRMTQMRYQVTGSWDKPVYTRLSGQPGGTQEEAGDDEEP